MITSAEHGKNNASWIPNLSHKMPLLLGAQPHAAEKPKQTVEMPHGGQPEPVAQSLHWAPSWHQHQLSSHVKADLKSNPPVPIKPLDLTPSGLEMSHPCWALPNYRLVSEVEGSYFKPLSVGGLLCSSKKLDEDSGAIGAFHRGNGGHRSISGSVR